MIVLGIDPGTANTGYGVVLAHGGRLAALDGGVIDTRAGVPLERRLAHIHARVSDLIREHEPAALAVEDLYFGRNAHTAFAVGQARGVVLLSAGMAGIPASRTRRRRSSRPSAAAGPPGRARCSGWSARCCRCRSRRARPRGGRARGGDLPRQRRLAEGGARMRWRRRRLRRRAARRPFFDGGGRVIASVRGTPRHAAARRRRDRGGRRWLPPERVLRDARRPAEGGRPGDALTHLILRDDGMHLYGFATEAERELFLMLIGVQGVGPKVALAVLSGRRPRELLNAIASGDTARFQAVPGIGKRTAERIIVELREKVAGRATDEIVVRRTASDDPRTLAREGLLGLGFTPQEADRLLDQSGGETPEDLIAEALRAAR